MKCDETNELVEKLSKIIDFLIVRVSVPGSLLPKAIFCLFIYFTTDLGHDAFKLSIPLWYFMDIYFVDFDIKLKSIRCLGFNISIERFPFDWRKPTGYSLAIALQTFMLAYPMRFLACFLTLALGGYLNSITIANDVIHDVKSFNHDKIWLKSKVDVHIKLFELTNLHSAAKQLSRKNKSLKAIQIIILFITIMLG